MLIEIIIQILFKVNKRNINNISYNFKYHSNCEVHIK